MKARLDVKLVLKAHGSPCCIENAILEPQGTLLRGFADAFDTQV